MSGGHFDYQESRLGYIAEQLERDIECNDISDDDTTGDGYGFQLEPKTIVFLKDVAQLKSLEHILREYDLAVSGDTCEKPFKSVSG